MQNMRVVIIARVRYKIFFTDFLHVSNIAQDEIKQKMPRNGGVFCFLIIF